MRPVIVCFWLLACSRPVATLPPEPPGCLQIDVTEMDFGAQPIFRSAEPRPVILSNRCEGSEPRGSISIQSIILGSGPPFAASAPPMLDLAAGLQTGFAVTFMPTRLGDFTDTLTITSTDPDAAPLVVELRGSGVGPRLEVSETALDFGDGLIGCTAAMPVRLENTGTTPLIITHLYTEESPVHFFRVDLDTPNNGTLPFTLAPPESTGRSAAEVFVTYAPPDERSHRGSLTMRSNDSLTPSLTLLASGTGVPFATQVDGFTFTGLRDTDLLFTLSREPSMYDNNADVLDNLRTWATRLVSGGPAPHVGLVVDDSGCILGPDPWIDETFTASAASTAFRTMADLDYTLSSYGSNSSRGFMLAEAALANTGPGRCNEGFRREHARLTLVHISDVADQSIDPWSDYVTRFRARVSDPDHLTIHAVAGDVPDGCDTAAAGLGYHEATVATGGTLHSICDSTWGAALPLPSRRLRAEVVLPLSRPAVEASIEVLIDGAPRTIGWAYDPERNSVVLDAAHFPAEGSPIDVQYVVLPDCD